MEIALRPAKEMDEPHGEDVRLKIEEGWQGRRRSREKTDMAVED